MGDGLIRVASRSRYITKVEGMINKVKSVVTGFKEMRCSIPGVLVISAGWVRGRRLSTH